MSNSLGAGDQLDASSTPKWEGHVQKSTDGTINGGVCSSGLVLKTFSIEKL